MQEEKVSVRDLHNAGLQMADIGVKEGEKESFSDMN